MKSLLFVTPCPLQTSKKSSKTCVRRPRTFACAPDPQERDRDIGEPSWMNMARDISPTGSDEAPCSPPKWKYPEGDPSKIPDHEKNSWDTWKAAIEKQPSLDERDIKAETDFWRAAAKEVVDDSNTTQSSKPSPTPPDDILTDESSKSEDVWRMARGVTGEMTELQQKLRSELERYDPDENTEQYREIARELVGPPQEPWENSDPIRTSQAEAEAGSGWNPDVDWMRFDDVRREQAKEAEKAARMEAERVAREQMETFTNDSQETFNTIDDELTKTFTDQSVDKSFIQETPTENLPGFLTNRVRRTGTYGSAWSDAEEEAQKLQEQGIPLRDPKADTDNWRSMAKELTTEIQADNDEAIVGEVEQKQKSSEIQSETEGEIDDVARELEETVFGEESVGKVNSSGDTDEESSWSSWRSGSAKWEAAVEEAEPRDPAKEVDMWRSSARELTSTMPASEESTLNTQSEVNGSNKPPENEGSVWDQWRSANAKWESSISGTIGDSEQESETKWRSSDQVDWGSGLGKKATSERSAWERWNNVSAIGANSGSSSWWNNRTDSPVENNFKPDRSFNNADEWRSIARETLNLPEKQVDSAPASREERIQNDTSLDSWRSIAKDLIEDHD